LPGVKEVNVDLARDEFTIIYDDQFSNVNKMQTQIIGLGYRPSLVRSRLAEAAKPLLIAERITPEPVAAALLQVKKDGTYIFIDFYAKWCGACKIMDMTTLVDPLVLSMLDRFQVLKVDADEYPDATQYYKVVGMPTYLVLDSAGQEAYRHVGPIDSSALIENLTPFTND
jgi:thiol:disulfide interchange protein